MVLILAAGYCKQMVLKLHYSYIVSESREKEIRSSQVQGSGIKIQRFNGLGLRLRLRPHTQGSKFWGLVLTANEAIRESGF
jgi:hypothetical protein